jgi:streptogramin lyase
MGLKTRAKITPIVIEAVLSVVLLFPLSAVAAVVITEYPVPCSCSSPRGITSGPDGNLWFTEDAGNKIGKVTTSGTFTEYTVPTSGSSPVGITSGPDSNLWFTEINGNNIGKATTAGVVGVPEFPYQVSGVVAIALVAVSYLVIRRSRALNELVR